MTDEAARAVRPGRLSPGLTLVSTPIGDAADITLRALGALRDADAIAAEDTRTLRRLMDMHAIPLNERPLIPYHDHNGARARPRILSLLGDGLRVVYASDAGTPLIADPGYRLVEAALEAGIPVSAAPGPCAAIMALSISGLPSDRFLFAGFAPVKTAARRAFYAELRAVPATLVLYESPRRLAASLADAARELGARRAVVARELTKLHEETRRDSLEALARAYDEETAPKGEVVLVIAPPSPAETPDEAAVDAALRTALETQTVKDAAASVARRTGLPRRALYTRALALRDENT